KTEQEASGAGNVGLVESAPGERLATSSAPGAVASAVGHTGAASGLAALVGAVLALDQQIRPPQGESPVGPRFWLNDRADGPRQAVVTGQGTDGTCLSVLLEA